MTETAHATNVEEGTTSAGGRESPLDLLRRAPKELLATAEGRRAITREHPGLFALVYLREHITAPDGSVSFSGFHTDIYDLGKQWMGPLGAAKEHRDVVIAPRNSGKTTTMFLILPMWAAAHGHARFIAAFGDSAGGAEGHLSTFKTELQQNELLRNDFPDLVTPKKGTNVSRIIADNRGQYIAESGFIFMARGMTSSNLGMKVGALRPDLIICDDIEPTGADYSPHQAEQRLSILRHSIFFLNEFARVVIVGTVQMQDSIIDQIKRADTDPDKYQWVFDERLRAHYYPAIINDNGKERSFWPERWDMDYFNSQRHSRVWQQEMMNVAVSPGAGYWEEHHIKTGVGIPRKTIVFVDPATTSHAKSDQTGIAVVSIDDVDGSPKVVLRECIGVRETSGELAIRVTDLVQDYEADAVVVESNQGGNLWNDTFADVGVPLHLTHSTKKKEYRIARAFSHYEKGRVLHAEHLPQLEEQQIAYPAVRNDDIVDAASTGILYILGEVGNKGKTKTKQMSYV